MISEIPSLGRPVQAGSDEVRMLAGHRVDSGLGMFPNGQSTPRGRRSFSLSAGKRASEVTIRPPQPYTSPDSAPPLP